MTLVFASVSVSLISDVFMLLACSYQALLASCEGETVLIVLPTSRHTHDS